MVILDGRRGRVECACPSSPIFRALADTQVANSGRRTACPGGFRKSGPRSAGRPLPSKYASLHPHPPPAEAQYRNREQVPSISFLKTGAEMQTKGSFLFTEGPPTGPSVSLSLCLPSRTKPPSWALKARFSAVNTTGPCLAPPGSAWNEKGPAG